MRASRLVSLLLLLQARGRLTAQQMADELEVSVRTVYRDVLARRLGSAVPPVHVDAIDDVASAAAKWTPESTLRRLEAVLECRAAIDANVKPQIAVESMMVTLWQG